MGNISRDIAEALADFGLEPGASIEEVKRRYLQLAAKWHPDKHPGDRIAEQAMKRVNSAKAVLTEHGTVPEAAPPESVVRATPVAPFAPFAPPPEMQLHRPGLGHLRNIGNERNTVYEIAKFTEQWVLSAMRAGHSNAEMPFLWIRELVPQVEARWGVRLCATYQCFSRAMNEDLCTEHQRTTIRPSNGESDASCKATDAYGMPCTNRALPGNHGFCGWHYGFGGWQP